MRERLTPLQKEWATLEKQEATYLMKRTEKTDSKMNQFLEKKVPPNLQNTLDAAFSKAFYAVFEKGTGVIEKTYKKEELQTYKDVLVFNELDNEASKIVLDAFDKINNAESKELLSFLSKKISLTVLDLHHPLAALAWS